MIGPPNRVPDAHAPQIETALVFTAPARPLGPTRPFHLRAAIAPILPSLRAGAKTWLAVANTTARMQGLHGPPIEWRQQACGASELAEKAAKR
jgi:hypothetical protein